MKRKDALRRLDGFAPRVEDHLTKIAGHPNSRDINHWKSEIRNWLAQSEDMLPYLGTKTAAKWAARIAAWEAELGD